MKERYHSGKMTVNWENIDYVEVQRDVDRFVVYFLYRPKIKTEKLKILKEFNSLADLREFMTSNNFFELDNYFINVHNYSIVEEVSFNDKNKKFSVILYMKNSAPLMLDIPRNTWSNFKNSRLL